MRKFIFFLLFSPCLVFSQNFSSQIDSTFNSKFNNGPAVSVLVTKDFKPFYVNVKGHSNLENNIKANEYSKFRIGSVTKQFTAIAILLLKEKGKLSLSDTIQKFLPTFPTKSRPISIEHLLTHTSGLKEITETEVFFEELMKNGCDPDTLVNYFKDYPLEFTPGSKFMYCNSGYHLLGLIVEKVSGVSFEDFIRKFILIPSDMQHTAVDNNSKIISNRVSGYEDYQGEIKNATYIDMSIPFSAGNLVSTTEDLNKWYKALFEYKIVSKSSLKKAHTPYQLLDSSRISYGYGWFIDSLQGEKIISHEGGINGFLSSVWYAPKSKTLISMLSNCMCNPTTSTAKTITAFAIGKPIKSIKRIKVAVNTLQKYVGNYLMNGENWVITLKEGELFFEMENGTGHFIYAKSKKEFFSEEWESKFLFEEKKGNNMQMTFSYLGGNVIGMKTIKNSVK